MLELDHVFIFCTPGVGLADRLLSAGFVETYRRQHPGQGTENICFCFDNAFVELLWVNNEAEIRSSSIARTALYERSRHLELGTCPFGIAWRGNSRISTWPYRPPYLPPPLAIDVATDGDDPHQPMMFRSPGDSPPSSWPTERRGNLQQQAGFQSIRIREFVMPGSTSPSPTLQLLAQKLGFAISNADRGYRIDLEIVQSSGQLPVVISLP
jgi:hypothetical protein